jgi:DNA-binding GntR family transcriptional regulator
VSRITVRRAVDELVDAGIFYRIQAAARASARAN